MQNRGESRPPAPLGLLIRLSSFIILHSTPMPSARPPRRPLPRPTRRVEPTTPSARGAWLTWVAFAVLVAVVVARMSMLETLRDPSPAEPGTPVPPAGPGPTAGLVLDLLACAPALLVLVRRWVDRTFALRLAWSTIPMGLL